MYQTDQDRIFRTVAEEYLAANEAGWTAKNSRHNRQLLQDHVYPVIGYRVLLSLSEAEYLAILERLLEKGMSETARRLRTRILHILEFAIEKGYATSSDLPFLAQG
ncbi:phage integrase central domain-containing protein [Cupriavidus pampae]|uniref:phage integrase central domain-containing protein n=1 Tax=Cupriavidus pampae TaxID=659251 RepID=UPI001CC4CC8A|nr:hypothetical protein [Cupriavidus pampae]